MSRLLLSIEPFPIRVQPTPAVTHHFFGEMVLEAGEERPIFVVVFKKRGEFRGVVSSSGFLGMQFADRVQVAHEYLVSVP